MPDTPTAPLTLIRFLEDAGARLRFYDMGRRVAPIPRERFLAFENNTEPYPAPLQQQAWVALVQTRSDTPTDPLIWFLRFDLDEQAKLVLATRDYLIHRFVEIASDASADRDLGQALRDNPCAFTPREDKMANLHARLHRDLDLAPSRYYAHARDYLQGRPGWEQWSFVGYQGLADIAARLDEDDNTAIIISALPHLPNEPLVALCHCLENHRIGIRLGEALGERLEQALDDRATSAAVLAGLLRGQSRADMQQVSATLRTLLADPRSSDPEVLAAVGGRAWEALASPEVATAYLERLASQEVGQEVFDQCVTDLLRMPDLRPRILDRLRAPDRSARLAGAFQAMLQR